MVFFIGRDFAVAAVGATVAGEARAACRAMFPEKWSVWFHFKECAGWRFQIKFRFPEVLAQT